MSKAQQRIALEAHAAGGVLVNAVLDRRSIEVMERNGHVEHREVAPRRWRIVMTRAGLLAAGVDMDAIHAEALAMNTPTPPAAVWDPAGGQRVCNRRNRGQQGVTQAHYPTGAGVLYFGVQWIGQRSWSWTSSGDVELIPDEDALDSLRCMVYSEGMTMSEHAKPLKPGEIRRHTVGIRTFQVMHVAGGGMAQATYRDDTRSTVICTDRDIDAVVRSYAEAIEQAESAAADALNDADDTQFIGAASGELVTGVDVGAVAKMSRAQRTAILEAHASAGRGTFSVHRETSLDAMVTEGWAVRTATVSGFPTRAGLIAAGIDVEQLHAEARVENLLRQRRTTYAAYGDGAFNDMVRRMQSSFGLPVTGAQYIEADLTFNTPEGADMALVTGEPTDSALKFYRVRPGYYESNWGHSIERFEALNGNPMTWVILYPGETVGDVSRPTLAEAVAYVEQNPGDAPGYTLAVAASAALAGTFGSTLLRPVDALPIHPKGTPEYDAYAAELKTELDKWVAGGEPYLYASAPTLADREPTAPADETLAERLELNPFGAQVIEDMDALDAPRRCVRTDGSHANHGEPVDGMNCDPDRSTAEDERVTAAQREVFGTPAPTAPAPEQRCTYGGDCTVHPDAQGLHDFDQDAPTPTDRVTLALDELATLREQIDYNPYQQDVAQDITDRFNRIEALLRSEAR